MNHSSHRQHENHQQSVIGSMLGMGLMMMLMCVGVLLAVSFASAIGGPIAWIAAGLVIITLVVAHAKLMNHGGH